ncbi:MAG: type II toxin-antitoxin system YafQ family toxin [Polaromonas sp.]
MSRILKETKQFKADKKRIQGSGRHDWTKMRDAVKELMNDRALEKQWFDHELSGDYADTRECHLAPDWLLVYVKSGDLETGSLKLIRTGSHSDLF